MSRNLVFQVSLLVLLTAIAIGIWANRNSPPQDTSGSQFFDSNSFQRDQPGQSSQPVLPPTSLAPLNANSPAAKTSDPSELLESIKQGEEVTIRVAVTNARRSRNSNYLIEAYRLACKHGTLKSLRPMNSMLVPLSKEDEQQIIAGMDELIERKQYDCIRYILTQNLGFGLTKTPLNTWMGDQFVREPWDRERMETVLPRALHFQGTNDLCVRMIIASLSGPEDRFDWLCQNLNQVPDASPLVIMSMLVKSNVINASNVNRMMQLSAHWGDNVDKSELFIACLPFLNAEHVTMVRRAMKSSNPSEQLLNYIFKYDAQDISTWSVGNLPFNLALHTQFKNAITSDKGAEALERFVPIMSFLVRECQQNTQWDVFTRENIPFTSSIQWLWSHGFRPRDSEPLALRLYLAIQCRDNKYLETLLSREKRAIPEILNNGFSLGYISVVKANNDERFVPLLAAIENCDIDTVQMLIETKRHNWKTWSFENPLAVALRANKSDIYRYLGAAGVTENTGLSASPQKSRDASGAAVAVDMRELRTIETAGKLLLRVVEAGDLAGLENVLANFPYRAPLTTLSTDPELQLQSYESSTQAWRYDSNLRAAFEKSISHPKLFARMLAEGFVIDLPILLSIVRDGHAEVFEMALCDMTTRQLVSSNYVKLDDAAQTWPKVLRVLTDSGVTMR